MIDDGNSHAVGVGLGHDFGYFGVNGGFAGDCLSDGSEGKAEGSEKRESHFPHGNSPFEAEHKARA
jgi:hypothetical protein